MYKIGNVIFEIKNVQNEQMLQGLEDFIVNDGIPDNIYEIVYVNNFSSFTQENIIYYNDSLVVQKKENKYCFYYLINNSIYAIKKENNNHDYVYLCKDALDAQFHKYFLPSILGLERILIKKDLFFLHSSYINYKNQAILFSAPSGGGKSTQADLWMKYKHAEIINGDRNTIGYVNENWFVYGTPFSGSSQYCINKTTKLNAIVILSKNLTNSIERIDEKGFPAVFSQVTVNSWDKDYCIKIIDLILRLCKEIPIYLLSCTKDEKAVECLYNKLIEDGVINEFSK